jgi:hypothetical protein
MEKVTMAPRINITTTNTIILTVQEPELVKKENIDYHADKKRKISVEVYELLSYNNSVSLCLVGGD